MPAKRKFNRNPDDEYADWDCEPMPDYEQEELEGPKIKASARLEREMQERREAGEKLISVIPQAARDLSVTCWGKAWNRHLQALADHVSILAKGRSEYRKGRVMDVAATPGQISAVVAGNRLWDVRIALNRLDAESWAELRQTCVGQISDLSALLAGEVPETVMQALSNPETGIFPTASELRAHCACPDHGSLCIHAAATLYAFGTLMDTDPALLFTARGGTPQDLIAKLDDVVGSLTSAETDASRSAALAGQDLSELFGTEIEE
jgi:uncharacterized Zn finger protein